MSGKIFPTVLILLQLCASAVHGFNGDVRMAVYWFAAAVVNMAVTL